MPKGQQLGGATSRLKSGGQQRRAIPHPRPEAAAQRSNPAPEARGGSGEEPHHIQGAVAARAHEGLGELSHAEGQEGWW